VAAECVVAAAAAAAAAAVECLDVSLRHQHNAPAEAIGSHKRFIRSQSTIL